MGHRRQITFDPTSFIAVRPHSTKFNRNPFSSSGDQMSWYSWTNSPLNTFTSWSLCREPTEIR